MSDLRQVVETFLGAYLVPKNVAKTVGDAAVMVEELGSETPHYQVDAANNEYPYTCVLCGAKFHYISEMMDHDAHPAWCKWRKAHALATNLRFEAAPRRVPFYLKADENGMLVCPECGDNQILAEEVVVSIGYLDYDSLALGHVFLRDEDAQEERISRVWCSDCGWERMLIPGEEVHVNPPSLTKRQEKAVTIAGLRALQGILDGREPSRDGLLGIIRDMTALCAPTHGELDRLIERLQQEQED